MSFNEWEKKPIKDITEFVTDYVANGSFAALAENVKYKEDPDFAYLIRLTDYKNSFNGPFVYVDEKAYSFLSKSKLLGGEIIIANVGANAGEVFQAPYLDKPMTLGPNAITLKTKFNDKFYYYWLRSREGQSAIKSLITGSAQPQFNKTHFRAMQVPVPPMNIQDRIASILSSLDNKIDLNRQTNQTLEAIAQAIFKEWFVDFNFPGATGEMQDSLLGEIPKGWRVSPIGELFDFVIGGDWGKESYQSEFPNQCAVIRGTDLDDIINANTTKVPIRFIKTSNLAKRELREGDIVFEISGGSKDQATGRNLFLTKALLNLLPYKAVPASFCRLIRAKDLPTAVFLGTYLKIFYNGGGPWDFQLQSTGISNFQFGYFEEKKLITVPNEESLKLYAEKIMPLYQLIGETVKQIQTLTQLRDSLLPKLMEGKIKIQ